MHALKVNENQGATVIKMPRQKPYTQILNEVLVKLYSPGFHLPGEQRAVFDFILRQTHGFQKKSDRISLSQFSEALGLKKPSVIRSIKALLAKKLINVSNIANESAKVYEINENTDEWLSLAEWLTLAKTLKVVSHIAKKPLAKLLPTKEIIKESIKEIIPPLIPPQGESETAQPGKIKKLSCLSKPQAEKFKLFWDAYPKHRRKEKPKAEKAFKDLNPDDQLFSEIMAGLQKAANSHDWTKNGGQYVCYPERFLRNQKWLDEYGSANSFKSSGCPMTGYMPPEDLAAKRAQYAHLLDGEPEF